MLLWRAAFASDDGDKTLSADPRFASFVSAYEETALRGWAYSSGEYEQYSEVISVPIMLGSRSQGAISVVQIGEEKFGCAFFQTFLPTLLQSAEEFSAQISERIAVTCG